MKKLVIHPVTRIEGHAKIDVYLDDAGHVADTHFHVTQVRGFEKFTEGRPYYEMPGITARICGICPISHQLASAKTCDAIMAVTPPPAAVQLRELVHCAQFVQSHALSFFHLSAPDLLLGFDSDPARRNIFGVIEENPELARAGIGLRKFGQDLIEGLAQERVHPGWIVPGGVNAPLKPEVRDKTLAALPEARIAAERALDVLKGALDRFTEEIAHFGNGPTMYAGLTDGKARPAWYDGMLQFRDAAAGFVATDVRACDYQQFIGEASVRRSYMKAPYFKPRGYPEGVYRVGPLARLNVAGSFGTPAADRELAEYRQRFGECPQSSFLYHYARLIELLHGLEKIGRILEPASILSKHVRARAGVNAQEGMGMIEAPRGILIHHYKVDESGAIRWANLIVATGHNNLAMDRDIGEVARHFVDGNDFKEGMLNRVSALVRAYDPCLSCSTHANGMPAVTIALRSRDGELIKMVD
ncbi:MAG: Ni/Fe hydrogenase subunit alpha [Acidobacteriota bacterium]|nr:Ni/Fe hydrogenase subunit alpha [Acidobacteriota bacterium]